MENVRFLVDPEDDFTFSASDEEDDTQLARAIADDMGYKSPLAAIFSSLYVCRR